MKILFLGLTLYPIMAYILHIDTSAENSLIALSKNGEMLSEVVNTEARNHAATININVETVLTDNGISLNDLSALAVCGGPGSYTGLRIGLATAKGFCYALDIPLMLHNRLLLMAAKYALQPEPPQNIIPILQAREGEYFIAAYNSQLDVINAPKHIFLDELLDYLTSFKENATCCGMLDEQIDNIISKLNILPFSGSDIDILSWCQYAFAEYKANSFADLASSEPFYLKQVYTHKSKIIK